MAGSKTLTWAGSLWRIYCVRSADIRADAIGRLNWCGGCRSFPKYVDALGEWSSILRFWDQTLQADGIDALAEQVSTLELPRLAAVPNSVPGKELAKACH